MTSNEVEQFLRTKVEHILSRPSMFGSDQAVEMQLLLAFELITEIRFSDRPAQIKTEMYTRSLMEVLNAKFGNSTYPLSARGMTKSDFVQTLRQVTDSFYTIVDEEAEKDRQAKLAREQNLRP